MLGVRALFRAEPDWLTHQPGSFTVITLLLLSASLIVWLSLLIPFLWLRRKAGPRVNYALHLVWFLPVIYAQWVVAPPIFFAHAALLGWVTAGFGIYYTLADLVAIRAGLWFFDSQQITGLKLGPLPWEEAAFFFLTSLLVAQSFLLLLPPHFR